MSDLRPIGYAVALVVILLFVAPFAVWWFLVPRMRETVRAVLEGEVYVHGPH